MVISNSTYLSQIRASQNLPARARPPTLFAPKSYPEHQPPPNLLSSCNRLPQTSFCPNLPTSLLFCPRISATTPHCSMVRTPKLRSPDSDGYLSLHLWTHHLCLHHLPTSSPTAMSCHGWLSPPSSTTSPPPSPPPTPQGKTQLLPLTGLPKT